MELTIQEINKEEAFMEWKQRQSDQLPQSSRLNSIRLVNKDVITVGFVDETTGLQAQKKEFNPEYGKLVAEWSDENGDHRKVLSTGSCQFYLAKSRQAIGFRDKADADKYLIPETDPFRSIQILDRETKEVVAKGKYKDLKEQYDLKYSEAAYVYFEDKIFRWKITGAHFESWFQLKKDLAAADEPKLFRVSDISEQGGDVTYNVMTFEVSESLPIEIAVSVERAVDEYFTARERQFTDLENKQIEDAVHEKPY